MLSVGLPSMAMIMSPMHRLAWAALLPGVTYKTEDTAGIFSLQMIQNVTKLTVCLWPHLNVKPVTE